MFKQWRVISTIVIGLVVAGCASFLPVAEETAFVATRTSADTDGDGVPDTELSPERLEEIVELSVQNVLAENSGAGVEDILARLDANGDGVADIFYQHYQPGSTLEAIARSVPTPFGDIGLGILGFLLLNFTRRRAGRPLVDAVRRAMDRYRVKA